jgi:hypothetical protein
LSSQAAVEGFFSAWIAFAVSGSVGFAARAAASRRAMNCSGGSA